MYDILSPLFKKETALIFGVLNAQSLSFSSSGWPMCFRAPDSSSLCMRRSDSPNGVLAANSICKHAVSGLLHPCIICCLK